MLPRANIYDVATYVCLPDGPQRVQRHLGKRFGSSRSSLRNGVARLLLTGWFSAAAFIAIWLAGLGLLTLWAPNGAGQFDLHLRLSLLVAWVLNMPLFWLDMRMLRLRQRIGRRARLSGFRGESHAAEVVSRRTQWNTLVGKDDGTAMLGRLVNALPAGMLLAMLPLLLISVPLAVWNGAGRAGDAIGLVFPAGLLAMIAIRQRLEKQAAAKFMEVSRAVICPECGYSLRAHVKQVEQTTGRTVGPARCPECGTHWPLVPPPCFFRFAEGAGRKRSGQVPQLVPAGLHSEDEASATDRPVA